jgi:hypothetical protein
LATCISVPIFHLAIEGTGWERDILSDAQSQSNELTRELTREGREEAYLALLANGMAEAENDIKKQRSKLFFSSCVLILHWFSYKSPLAFLNKLCAEYEKIFFSPTLLPHCFLFCGVVFEKNINNTVQWVAVRDILAFSASFSFRFAL